ncbi:uncharacterized protein LOC126896265 [Daktulosphaira vitifoliae]|uniref:uncharacterized protein LOC126896265 n=1 Tax=Daktulosphaira vitifoliae TaxID=58002 RepID=UPI0021AA8D0E|nr:uncharacterized protein LOC126896265 [Daktulosphaira vitifoliae]
MYYYILIIIYIASSFSNGFIFTSYPLKENMELTNSASSALKKFFLYLTKEEGMGCKKCTMILNAFNWVHKINNNEIQKLFKDENISKDEFMNFEQFKKLATKRIIQLENSIEKRFKMVSKGQIMITLKELIIVLRSLHIQFTEDNVIELVSHVNDKVPERIIMEDKGAQRIGMEAFRKIFTTIFHNNAVELMDKKYGENAIIDLTYFNV